MDATCVGVRDSQILHLCEGAAYGGHFAKGRQDVERLGMEYWEGAEQEGCHFIDKWDGSQYEGIESQE